jgi:predicted ArsR family transcriptional regulator
MRPAGTPELAERLGLHPNEVRNHLERMEQAGLVERARVLRQARLAAGGLADRRGRTARRGPPRAYRDLGRWLARTFGASPPALVI